MKFILLIVASIIYVGCSTQNKTMSNHNKITETYWKLIKLEGLPVDVVNEGLSMESEPYFMLKEKDFLLVAKSGCNTMNGKYKLEKDKLRIKFSEMASTLKACPDMKMNEADYFKVFELADNYTINGDTLFLNIGRRAPLAEFQAVYFK